MTVHPQTRVKTRETIGHWRKTNKVSWEKLENEKMSHLQSAKKRNLESFKQKIRIFSLWSSLKHCGIDL